MKRNLQRLLMVIVIPTVTIFAAYNIMPDKKGYGFSRQIKNGFAKEESKISYKGTIIGICGKSSNYIYFKTLNPKTIFTASKNLQSTFTVELALKPNLNISQAFGIQIDSPDVTIYAYNVPAILKTWLFNAPTNINIEKMTGEPFYGAVKCSKYTYIIRRYDSSIKDFVFAKINSTGNQIASIYDSSIINKDNGLSTQGTLLFDNIGEHIFFVYKFFNRILCLDTNLNLIYCSHSIDTITSPNLNMRKYKKYGKVMGTYSVPPQYTNVNSCITNQHFLVHSLVESDNLNTSTFNNNAVIDVYRIIDGAYEFSFYLSRGKTSSLSSFTIDGRNLIAVFDKGKSIVNYRCDQIL